MSDPSNARWLPRLQRLVLRMGHRRTTLALTLVVSLLSLAVAHSVISLAGHGDRWVATLSTLLCCLVLTPVFGAMFLRLVFDLEDARAKLSVLATQDSLTGIANRRHFMDLAEREWTRCRRYDLGAAVMLIDADNFKLVNDRHGHLCGDRLLCEISRVAATSLRRVDLLARFGGDELIVFLPHTDPLGALDAAERIRQQVLALGFSWLGAAIDTSVSIGVASLSANHATLDALIHDADVALYAAKEAGRNCVRAAPGGGRPNQASGAASGLRGLRR